MKTITLEIPIPEYSWVDVPTLYRTCLGEVTDLMHVKQIQHLIEYLQRHEDRFAIIEMEYNIRGMLCRELVRQKLPYVEEVNIHYIGDKLNGFLMRFRESVGYNFDEYQFTHQVLSNGKKIQFKTFTMLFNDEDEAYRHIGKIFTSDKSYPFKLNQK